MTVVLAHATLASFLPPSVRSGHVVVDGGLIAAIADDIPDGAESVVDCRGRLIMPGNVCAHTHLYSALARGMPTPSRQPKNFPEILELVWWRLDRALDESGVRYSGLVGSLDAVRAGTTCLIDHHASPNFIDGSLDVLAGAVQEVGARAVVCYEVTDRNGRAGREAGLRENERFLVHNRSETVAGVVGAHASFTLDDETLEQLASLALQLDSGVHIHLAEDVCDEEDSLRRSGKRAAQRLLDAGVLGPRSIAAHCVHLDPAELAAVTQSDAWLVHNCRSNMNNAVGRAPVLSFGARSALGTDGIDEDMFAESRSAFFRTREGDVTVGADDFTSLLARGADLASEFFPQPLGRLESGHAADLVVLRYDPPTPLTTANLPWHWMFAFQPSLVESVMVAGRWILRQGEFCTVDEEKVRAEARREAAGLWERMQTL